MGVKLSHNYRRTFYISCLTLGVNDVGVTPALRRRRERAERQRSLIREQEDASRLSPSQMDEPFDDCSTSFTSKQQKTKPNHRSDEYLSSTNYLLSL